MNVQLFFNKEFKIKFSKNNKKKHNENNRKNEAIKNRLKNLKGWTRNIKIISLPSPPPITFKLNKKNERRKTIKKKRNLVE